MTRLLTKIYRHYKEGEMHFERRDSIYRYVFLLFAIFLLMNMSGCASIVSGTTQQVTIKSMPEGAAVTIAGRAYGNTPVTATLDKKTDQVVTLEKEGYKTETFPLKTTLDGWFWGNIVLGGVIGSTTDGISGAVNEYSPDQYFITLTPTTPKEESDSERKKREAKVFIISNYKSIMEDVAASKGQYIDSLLNLLNVNAPEDREGSIIKIKKLSSEIMDIPDFADSVISQVGKYNQAAQ